VLNFEHFEFRGGPEGRPEPPSGEQMPPSEQQGSNNRQRWARLRLGGEACPRSGGVRCWIEHGRRRRHSQHEEHRDEHPAAYLRHQLARIYLLIEEREKALDQLEPLLKIPYYLSPGWLKIDPTFDPLRGNPRFQRLVNGS
jgi:hypothetical protein